MKISVVTINFNNSEGLAKTLESVYNQTYRDLEMVVIDGGSTDESVDCVPSFQGRIGYFVSELDSGIYDAQNKGWQKSTGEYVLFLNSGDVFVSNDVLEKLVFIQPLEDIVYGNMILVTTDAVERRVEMPPRLSLIHMYRDTIWHPVSLIRKSLLEAAGGYDIQFRIAADYDFFCHALFDLKCTYRHVNVEISKFHSDGLSSNPSNSQLLLRERAIIQDRWMPKALLFLFRLYSKFRNKW